MTDCLLLSARKEALRGARTLTLSPHWFKRPSDTTRTKPIGQKLKLIQWFVYK